MPDVILNQYVVYACVFFALVLPVLLWKRDDSGAGKADVCITFSFCP